VPSPSLFTTLRIQSGRVLLADLHEGRLREGAERFGLVWDGDLRAALAPVASDGDDLRVRIVLTATAPPQVAAAPYAEPARPWRCVPVPCSQTPAAVAYKTTARAEYARARAAAGDADDALLIGHDGRLLETTIANVFVLDEHGTLATPPASDALLPGLVRRRILEQWPQTAERSLFTADLASARAVVATNALFLAHAIGQVEGVARFESDALARDLKVFLRSHDPEFRIIT